MIDKSNEIIKQLNRLANDRSLTPKVRGNIREAAQHIKDLHSGVRRIRDLYQNLKNIKTGSRSRC